MLSPMRFAVVIRGNARELDGARDRAAVRAVRCWMPDVGRVSERRRSLKRCISLDVQSFIGQFTPESLASGYFGCVAFIIERGRSEFVGGRFLSRVAGRFEITGPRATQSGICCSSDERNGSHDRRSQYDLYRRRFLVLAGTQNRSNSMALTFAEAQGSIGFLGESNLDIRMAN